MRQKSSGSRKIKSITVTAPNGMVVTIPLVNQKINANSNDLQRLEQIGNNIRSNFLQQVHNVAEEEIVQQTDIRNNSEFIQQQDNVTKEKMMQQVSKETDLFPFSYFGSDEFDWDQLEFDWDQLEFDLPIKVRRNISSQ